MEEKLNLFQKLAKIRAMSDVAQKNKQGFKYTYTDITEILANVTGGMKKYGVSLIPMIVPNTSSVDKNELVATKFDKKGEAYDQKTTEFLFTADMLFKWVNDEDPAEVIDVPWFITGSMADPAQAVGSGLTYTTRQFLTAYFQIAQSADIDVDEYRSKQKQAEESESKAIAESIIKDFDVMVKTFLADNQDKKDEVIAFLKKYAKNANYLAIKEPSLASKLVNDFKVTYMKEK